MHGLATSNSHNNYNSNNNYNNNNNYNGVAHMITLNSHQTTKSRNNINPPPKIKKSNLSQLLLHQV